MKVELISSTKEVIAGISASICRNQTLDSESEYLELAKRVIDYGHESIAEHVYFTFKITGISRVCTHQLVRHRIASFSQMSQRHVVPTGENDDWYVIPQSILDKPHGKKIFKRVIEQVIGNYNALRQMGVPIEDCRFLLPSATKSDLVMTMNARSLWNLFDHRICNRAQWEIRELSKMILHLLLQNTTILFKDWKPKCDNCKEHCGNEINHLELKNGTISNGKVVEYNG